MIRTDGKPTIACPRGRKELSDAERAQRIDSERVIGAAEKITEEAAEAYDKSKVDPYDEAHGRDR